MKKIFSILFLVFISISAFSQWDVREIFTAPELHTYYVKVADGRNDGVNRIYLTTRNVAAPASDGTVLEYSFDGTNWNLTATIITGLLNQVTIDVAPGRNDGVNRIYMVEHDDSTVLREATWNGSSFDVVSIDTTGQGMISCIVDDGRDDGVNRVYIGGWDQHYEYSWNGSSWDKVNIITHGIEGPCFIGEGKNDGVSRYYACGDYINEISWGGSSFSSTSTVSTAGGWAESVIIADGRSDGVNRVYSQEDAGNFLELTWNGASWDSKTVDARQGRSQIFSGIPKNDGKTYLYDVYPGNTLREYVYNSGSGNFDNLDIDAASGATASLDIGVGRNDDTVRIYAPNYAAGTMWEITSTTPYIFPRVTWGTKVFTEAAADDGSLDGSTSLTLTDDNFVLSSGTFTENTHYTVTNLPSSLAVVITLTSDTEATITLSGNADNHENVNNVSNVEITFLDAAFVKGVASDVTNYSQNDISIVFNGPELTWGTSLAEATINDGSISGALSIDLTGGTFVLSSGTFTESTHYTVSNVPAGLTAVITATANNTAELTLTGKATAHENTDDIANLTVTFLDAAFTGNDAAAVLNNSKADISVDYTDAGTVNWSLSSLSESGLNDGSIMGSIDITLTGNENFAGASLVENTDFTATNVPAGLTVDISVTNSTTAVLTLTGNATDHTSADNISNLTIEFLDAAFQSTNASNITNALKNDITLNFQDPPATPTMAWSDTALFEDIANNGGIFTKLDIILYVETFTVSSGVLTENTDYYVTNVPAGLTLVITATSDTTAELSMTGIATDHESANSTGMMLDFASSVFTGADSSAVTGSSLIISVNFDDAVVGIKDNKTEMSVYPNPANNYIKFNLNDLSTVKVDLMDMNGRVMISKELNSSNNRIDISKINPGAYLLILDNGESRETKKIIIQ